MCCSKLLSAFIILSSTLQVPKIGGATSFSNADVFVKPVKGTATFFSYMNAETKQMDYGLTEHSGCPVIEGGKWIAVTWMRFGVTNDRPHRLLDPSGDLIFSPTNNK